MRSSNRIAAGLLLIATPAMARWGVGASTPVAESSAVAKAPTPSVPQYVAQLRAPDAETRLEAVRALGALGPKAKDAAPSLLVALSETAASDHPAVRDASKEIAQALHKVDPAAAVPAETLQHLIQRATQPAARRRVQGASIPQCGNQADAIQVLGILGASARPVLPELVLLTRKPCVQASAASAIALIGAPNAEQADVILKNLKSADPEARQATLDFAAGLDPATPGLVLSVARALNDAVPAVRLAALETLEKLHPEREGRLALVAPFLKDVSPELRERALEVIALMGPDARAAIPALESALADSEPKLRLQAARLLRRVDPRSEKLMEALVALAKDPASETGDMAAEILRTIETGDPRIARALAPYEERERRKRVQKAWADTTPQQRDANGRSLRVEAIKIAADIAAGQPLRSERSFPSYINPLFCWTEVTLSSAPAVLHHVWSHNGKLVSDQSVEVLSAPDRVWTRQAVKPGRWKVEVKSEASSEPLATIQFSVYEESRPAAKSSSRRHSR